MIGEMLDIAATAELLQIHPESVRRMARERRLPAFKVGREWRFKLVALESWMEVQAGEAGARHVVVVDDDKSVRTIIGISLARAGYKVDIAADAPAAIELIQKRLPDLFFLDLSLPGVSGVDLLHKIKAIDPRMPVVIITGYPNSRLLQGALKYSPLMVLTKPVDTPRLLDAAESALAMHREDRGARLS